MSVVSTEPPPPVTDRPRGGGDSRWVLLVKADNDIDAHLLIGRLGEAGIESRAVKDRAAPGAWLYGGMNPWAPVTVYVRRFQFDDARLLLAEVAYDAPDAEPSSVVARRPKVPFRWWATALALGLALTGIALSQLATHASCQLRVFCNEDATNL